MRNRFKIFELIAISIILYCTINVPIVLSQSKYSEIPVDSAKIYRLSEAFKRDSLGCGSERLPAIDTLRQIIDLRSLNFDQIINLLGKPNSQGYYGDSLHITECICYIENGCWVEKGKLDYDPSQSLIFFIDTISEKVVKMNFVIH